MEINRPTVTIERSISMICIPDRDTADHDPRSGFNIWGIQLVADLGSQCELTRLKHKHGPRLLKAIIRKDRPGRSGTSRTYTLRYTIRETETRILF